MNSFSGRNRNAINLAGLALGGLGLILGTLAISRARIGRRNEERRERRFVSIAAIAATAATGALAVAMKRSRRRIQAVKSVTINRSPEELHAALRNSGNLPRFINGLESVNMTGEKEFRWVFKSPAGKRAEMRAEIVEDRPDRITVQCRREGREFVATIRLIPAAGERGTVVCLTVETTSRARMLGQPVARVLQKTLEKRIEGDLRRFEQWVETGTVVTTKGQPTGRSRQGLISFLEPAGT